MRVIAVATPRDKQERARFAHPNLNEARLDIEPLSDDSCIDGVEEGLASYAYRKQTA